MNTILRVDAAAGPLATNALVEKHIEAGIAAVRALGSPNASFMMWFAVLGVARARGDAALARKASALLKRLLSRTDPTIPECVEFVDELRRHRSCRRETP